MTRLVMAMTLIIEANYYLSGNKLDCDVKDQIAHRPRCAR